MGDGLRIGDWVQALVKRNPPPLAIIGGNSSQTAFGARAGATVLTRATTILGALFMLGALALNVLGGRVSGGSVVSGESKDLGDLKPLTAPPR